jgi:hypothetical protein
LKVLSGRRGFPKNRDKLLASLNAKNLQKNLKVLSGRQRFLKKSGPKIINKKTFKKI